MRNITSDELNPNFALDERVIIADAINQLSAKFENIIVIVAHPTPEDKETVPVAACIWGSPKFKTNVAKKMYRDFVENK
jgi:hypothetical protein